MFSGRRKHPATKAALARALGVGAWGVGASLLGLGSAASAAEPTQQELLEQIKALQAKVERLESRQDEQAGRPETAPAQDAAGPAGVEPAGADDVVRDAERRSTPQFMQTGGFTAGYSKNKFLIQDEAGNFVMNPNFQLQFRHVANFRSENNADPDDPSSDSQVDSGFEIRRMKFAVDGNMFGPDLTYKLQWATNRSNGQLLLEEAWVRYALRDFAGEATRDLAVRAGQFKDITYHEEVTSSKRQLAVDRSLMNEQLAGGLTDYVQGVTVIWDDGVEGLPLRAEVGYTDGVNSDNTNFQDGGGNATYGVASPDWGAVGRIEYLAMGTWKQYDDFTAMGNTQDLLVFGAGAHYSEAGNGDAIFHTVDVQYETGRLGLYGAYVGVYGEPTGGSVTEGGVYDSGFLVQGGFMLNDKWELFGRYDMLMLDENRLGDGAEDTFSEITVGLNWYMKGHAAKFTIDGTFLPEGSPANDPGIGILDPDGDESQFVLRSQFQLLL
jgi:hypothetical protein